MIFISLICSFIFFLIVITSFGSIIYIAFSTVKIIYETLLIWMGDEELKKKKDEETYMNNHY